MIIFNDKLSL